MNYTSCHVPHIQGSDVPSTRRYMSMMITSFFLIIFHSCRCFQTNINSLQNFSDILLILLPLEFYRYFTTTTMETAEYWLMACKYAIWNATITSLQFWAEDLDPITPRHCLRMHLHHLLLDTYQPHTTPTI